MEILLLLNVVLAVSGYALPAPCVLLAWRVELSNRETPPVNIRRHTISRIGLALATVGLAFWVYAVVREIRGTYSYIEPSAVVARWVYAGLIPLAAFAEPRARKYLLLATVGMFFFFLSSIGDWFI